MGKNFSMAFNSMMSFFRPINQFCSRNPDEHLYILLEVEPELETEYRIALVLWPGTAHMPTLKDQALRPDVLRSHTQSLDLTTHQIPLRVLRGSILFSTSTYS